MLRSSLFHEDPPSNNTRWRSGFQYMNLGSTTNQSTVYGGKHHNRNRYARESAPFSSSWSSAGKVIIAKSPEAERLASHTPWAGKQMFGLNTAPIMQETEARLGLVDSIVLTTKNEYRAAGLNWSVFKKTTMGWGGGFGKGQWEQLTGKNETKFFVA